MYPILGRYGPFFLYSYTVVLGLGLAAALGLTAWQARRQQMNGAWLDGLLAGLAGALLGGRAAYVWANWSYYREQPAEIGLVWQGGLGYHGGLLAGALALWLWVRWRKRPLSPLLGLLAPALALGSSFGWLACWLEGCAYGRESAPGVLAANLPDNLGVYALRYQTQLLGLLFTFLTFVLIWRLRRRLGPARLFGLAVLLLSAGRLIVDLLRGDPMPVFAGWRLDLWLDGSLALAGLLLLVYRAPKAPNETAV